MKISESMISTNQNYINYWTAKSSYDDLNNFVSKYTKEIGDEDSCSYDCSGIFEREHNSEGECLENYCIRAKLVKLATETCEFFCKAILIDNGKNWGDMKKFWA